MLKKFFASLIIFLFALPCVVFAAAPNNNNTVGYNYTNADPFHLSPTAYSIDVYQTTSSPIYSYYTNNFGDISFFYQVRDVTGETYYDNNNVGGPQWFATVYENYSAAYVNNNNAGNNQATQQRTPYRRTLGGQIDSIPVYVIGDILDGFNFVFAQEPEPYNAYEPYNENNTSTLPVSGNNTTDLTNTLVTYDRYPDPLETLCVITTDGTAKLNVKFANPYARHFPFWWNWDSKTNDLSNYSWWQTLYDWTDMLAKYTVEPVAYIYNPDDGKIYSRSSVYSNFSPVYSIVTSGDEVYINDTSGNSLYIISGDVDDDPFLVCSNDTVYYSVSNSEGKIYNSSGKLAYTLESALNDDCVYVCSPRTVKESILVQGLDDYEYQISISPTTETDVNSAEYLDANINIRGDSGVYGSKLAYITFRQRASFMSGYENFREASPIPLVFTNVSKGNAADNPLIFDLTIFNDDKVVKRMKFTWDAQENLPDQDLGTFFIMKQISELESDVETAPVYDIEARVTNRTGTRYMLYRYDRANPGTGVQSYTLPKYWAFDLTEDTYGTLPNRFLLDSHSQIAPGLVTVYDEELDITKDTSALDSFRLYEYNYGNPKDLWLNYKRVGGMYVDGDPTEIYSTLVADTYPDFIGEIQAFTMDFTDIKDDDDNTESEIKTLTGKTPLLPWRSELASISTGASYFYINSSAMNSFQISSNNLSEMLSFLDAYTETDDDTTTDETNTDTGTNETEDTTTDTEELTASVAAISSDYMAVVPMKIRLQIPRKSQLLKDNWVELDAAENPRDLFRIFNKYGTVRVRSTAASELDADLFRAIGEKGSDLGVSAADCVSAFIYDNYLYLDFIIFAADAVSKNTGKTAFVEIFKDDDVPYILIGDGSVDKYINLAFYVSTPLEAASSSSSSSDSTEAHSSGNGGTCNINNAGILILLLAMFKLKKLGVRI